MGDHPNVLKLQFPIAYVASGEVSLYAYNHLSSESPHRKVGHHLW